MDEDDIGAGAPGSDISTLTPQLRNGNADEKNISVRGIGERL